MLVTATADVVRALLQRADAELALGAARNAAVSIAVRHAREFEDARTLRDLRRLDEDPDEEARPEGRPPARRRS